MTEKPKEQELVDYIYGSMTKEEKLMFEKKLEQHPELQTELEELMQTQSLLGQVDDAEVIAPGFKEFSLWKHKWGEIPRAVWAISSIAASLLLLMTLGYFTNFGMQISREGFQLGYGNMSNAASIEEADVYLVKKEIDALLDAKILAARIDWEKELDGTENTFQQQFAAHKSTQEEQISHLSQQDKSLTDEQILNFVAQMKDENKQQIANLFNATLQEQDKYVQQVLSEFAKYLNEQRQEDLKMIQANFMELRSNTDERQYETEKILTSIITTVNNQNSAGR